MRRRGVLGILGLVFLAAAGRAAVASLAAASPQARGGGTPAPAACTATPDYVGPPRRSAPPQLWRRDFTRSIDGVLPAELQRRLEAAVDKIVARAPAVSAAVAIPGRGRWSVTRGLARRDPPTEVLPSQPFQVASTTKTFTAAVVLQLVREGKLRLDDVVARWLPDVPNAALITVDHLLRHTNGLVSFNVLPALGTAYRSPREVIALGAGESPQFCPGTNWAYTNTGYALLGVIVERLEGRPLADVFDIRLIQPLGLKQTTLRRPGVAWPIVGGHASGRPVTVEDGYATGYAAGSLAAPAEALVTFWHALLGGRIVDASAVQAMFTDMAAMGPGGQSFYGRGVQLYDVPQGPGLMVGHSGGIAGFTSVVAYVPADDVFLSLAVNDKDVPAEAGLWALLQAIRAPK
jgi:D-alanyl-D-alanine carboxypeptidase